MPYLIDRQRALWMGDVVAVIKGQRRRARSRLILRDNSLYHTLTRPQTLVRQTSHFSAVLISIGWPKGAQAPHQGITWQKQR